MASESGENGSKTNIFDGKQSVGDGSRSLRLKSLMNKSHRYFIFYYI